MAGEIYTHFDVLNRLDEDEARKNAPESLRAIHPLSSRVVVSIDSAASLEPIRNWFSDLFAPRFDKERDNLILESLDGAPSRVLPVIFEVLDEEDKAENHALRLRPTLAKSKIAVYNSRYARPIALPIDDCPPVLTFHSFKGGMGRTTLALALTDGLVRGGSRVLFVDADFEAPGISTLLKQEIPSPRVSFADLLALAHSSLDPWAEDALDLVAERLAEQVVDGLTVLPCTRDLGLPDTVPEALTYSNNRSAFFVGELLARLGKKIGVDLVLVDLRAGLSELVASLFLDPRLQHVLVTTLNGQAIDGTIMLLERMKDTAEKWAEATGESLEPNLTVLVNQVPTIADGYVSDALKTLDDELRKFTEVMPEQSQLPEIAGTANPFFDRPITPIQLPAIDRISFLPRDLTGARKLLSETVAQKMMLENFSDLLPAPSSVSAASVNSRAERCRKLADYAGAAIFAESAAQEAIFPTRSLIKLAERHLAGLPAAVVLGDKGAGKTYTFMSLALSKDWGTFVDKLLPSTVQHRDALILPVTPPQDLNDQSRDLVRSITDEVARQVSGNAVLSDQLLTDAVERQKNQPEAKNISSWRNFWLDMIAWRCGHRVNESGAFNDFPDFLANQDKRIIAIFDGIETIFKQVRNSDVEAAAVEALLRHVPDWLLAHPARKVGAIIFIREDVARLSLANNFKQFESRYGAYALKWNWAEALALALWIAQKSGGISSGINPVDLVDKDEEGRGEALEPLWGRKLGAKNSREARSQEWVMSSLSDFNRQIKARDLVRFLHEAAKRSTDSDTFYDDRLLSPKSMRDAIDPCSVERVSETGEENKELENIFSAITKLNVSQQEFPWKLDQAIERIGSDSVRILEENGIFFRDEDEYYVPEIYRNGLKLYYSGGARRRVVTLMRRTPNQTR